MVSKAFAVRLGAENIAVYDVQPGLIATEMTAAGHRQYRAAGRGGADALPAASASPRRWAAIIAALASGRLPYTTGQVISADAGMLVPRF